MHSTRQSSRPQTYFEASVDDHARKTLATYPRALAAILGKVRRGYLLRMGLEVVDQEIERRSQGRRRGGPDANARGWLDGTETCIEEKISGPLQREILEEMSADGAFRNSLRRAIRRILKAEHLSSTGTSRLTDWTAERTQVPTTDGPWRVRSSWGLASATELEGKPEGLCLALACRMLNISSTSFSDEDGLSLGRGTFDEGRAPGTEEDQGPDAPRRVLDWGSGYYRALAGAIDAIGQEQQTVRLVEVDVVGGLSLRERSCVAGRFREIGDLHAADVFDAVVLTLPSPGERSAARHREHYKDREPPSEEERLPDVGRCGPTKWNRELLRRLQALPRLLKRDGEAILVLPRSVRTASGYRSQPTLLNGAEAVLARAGLAVFLRFDLIEEDPVAMPFIVRSRPERVVWFVRRGDVA